MSITNSNEDLCFDSSSIGSCGEAMATANTNDHLSFGSSQSDSAISSDEDDTALSDNESLIEKRTITDPLFMHISRNAPIRELLRWKEVSKKISDVVSDHYAITAQARWKDNTMDWYFPLLAQINRPIQLHGFIDRDVLDPRRVGPTWTWSGIHHPSGEVHQLPSLSQFFPKASFVDDFLLASSEGLVLLDRPRVFEQDPDKHVMWWRNLVVSNPVTEEWRVLPVPDERCRELLAQDYGGFIAHMVADAKANTYKVILALKEALVVYKSTSTNWRGSELPEPYPESIRLSYNGQTSGTFVNGRLHFVALACLDYDVEAHLEVANRIMVTGGQVKVYEVDDEAGMWKPEVRYELRNYIPSGLHTAYNNYGFQIGSYLVGMVQCMGGMYVIIPAVLNLIGENIRQIYGLSSPKLRCTEVGMLPLQFYVLRLEGSGGRTFGQVVIQDAPRARVPSSTRLPNSAFRGSLKKWFRVCALDLDLFQHTDESTLRWYRCTARGSVIWVAIRYYLLQYDVVSGRSTTEFIGNSASSGKALEDSFTFDPSLHMKP